MYILYWSSAQGLSTVRYWCSSISRLADISYAFIWFIVHEFDLLVGCSLFSSLPVTYTHKVLTYVEYRAVSGVFQNIDPHPLYTQRLCPPPAPKAGGGTHSPGCEGVGGHYCGRRQTLDWPLTV